MNYYAYWIAPRPSLHIKRYCDQDFHCYCGLCQAMPNGEWLL